MLQEPMHDFQRPKNNSDKSQCLEKVPVKSLLKL